LFDVTFFPRAPYSLLGSTRGEHACSLLKRPEALPTVLRILIADAHEVVRTGLQRIIQSQAAWELVAVAADGKEAVHQALLTRPDVAVIGYALPLLNGIEVTRQIRASLPKTEVLIFTVHEDEALISQLLKAGARGYLLKSDANSQLIVAIETLAMHRPFFTAKVSEALLRSFAEGPHHQELPLSPRERQIVQLIAEGHSSKAIAKLLNISLKTVEAHRAAIMRKLSLSSAAALVRYAIRTKIVEP
jgi:DNA-binding NarL/FixJ family response regulator